LKNKAQTSAPKLSSKAPLNPRVRRAHALLLAWRGRRPLLMNYQTRVQATAAPEVFRILHLLSDWTCPSDLWRVLPEYSPRSILAGIRQLVKNSFLVEEGTREADRDADLASVWSAWLPDGGFHFATKDVNFLKPPAARRLFRSYLAESAQPALVKICSDAPRLQLAKETVGESEFTRVLFARRTHREYARKPISLSTISTLLYFTWGVTGKLEARPFGQLFLKTSPSGGARHPGEVYLLAMRVEGLAQGLYHYDGVHHQLEWLRSVPARKKAVQYTADQDFLEDASAVFLMTAVFPRVLWKYRFARAYRAVLLDAGHLCQTFCLVATWLGLAPFCTAALRDTLIEQDLGLDGIRESAIYVAAVGVPISDTLRSSR
jgi:SagB-type dehydrogenase family enzyme